jgi:hypothetical protein
MPSASTTILNSDFILNDDKWEYIYTLQNHNDPRTVFVTTAMIYPGDSYFAYSEPDSILTKINETNSNNIDVIIGVSIPPDQMRISIIYGS